MYYGRHGIETTLLMAILIFIPLSSYAQMDINQALSRGESVYVPIYSNVYAGPKASPFLLSAMLSIRNTDPKNEITILKADYYDSNGKMIEGYMKSPVKLLPLASTFVHIKERDTRGGPGASFLVKWQSEKWINRPIIEGVMLGIVSGRGVSFICPGQILVDDTK
jgi:hypothetical protein